MYIKDQVNIHHQSMLYNKNEHKTRNKYVSKSVVDNPYLSMLESIRCTALLFEQIARIKVLEV